MEDKYYYYNVYGSIIKSEIIFPGISCKKKSPDINIFFDQLNISDVVSESFLTENFKAQFCRDKTYISWKDKVICCIENHSIIINSQIKIDKSFLVGILVGCAIPLLLHHKGNLILHANAINIKGLSIALIGPKGSGKSTLSANLIKKGHHLISDDILCVKTIKESHFTYNGFSTIKLWPDAILSLNENPCLMPKINSNIEKRYYYSEKELISDKIPLKAIYALRESNDTTYIKSMSKQNGVIELVKSTLWGHIFNENELCNNLKICAQIARDVPIYTLNMEKKIRNIPYLIKTIEKNI